jgi:hypothetical protein
MAGSERDVYVPKDTIVVYDEEGVSHVLKRGRSRLRAGHPFLEQAGLDNFELLPVDYDVEQATAHPGEKRGDPPFDGGAGDGDTGGGAGDGETPPAEPPPPEKPGSSATKAEWVDHAVARGMDQAEAEGKTKAELLAELYPDG